MIPKVIHYCWFGLNPLPTRVKEYIKTWQKYCPDYKIIEWNESNFDVNCHPFVKAAYEAKAWAFVSDYARLKVVYDNGGVYLDTDVELVKTLDSLLSHRFYIGVQQIDSICASGLGFGAEKGNEIVEQMMEYYSSIEFNTENLESIACPNINHQILVNNGYKSQDSIWLKNGIAVYPSEYFDPISPGNTKYLRSSKTISIHHYDASWTGRSHRMKRWIMNRMGYDKVKQIKSFFERK